MNINEKNILHGCIKQIDNLPAVKKVKVLNKQLKKDKIFSDAIIDVYTETEKERLQIEIKNIIKRPLPVHLAHRKYNKKNKLLLMATYINPSIAEDLQNNHINFIDTQGNAYIYISDTFFVERIGRKPDDKVKPKLPSVFHTKGMQLLFIILTVKGALNQTVRKLAQMAGISKDRAASGIHDLVNKDYIYKDNKNKYHFINKKNLLEHWLISYGERLRPKLVLDTFMIKPSFQNDVEEIIKKSFINKSQDYALTGGVASDVLSPYYRGPTVEIFINPEMQKFVQKNLNLIPAMNPNVTLLKMFSPKIIFEEYKKYSVAHPLLIYAELLYKNSDRARETAERIYNQYLQKDYNET